MKKYALIFKCPTCGKVVTAIAFNMLGKRDIAAELSSDIRQNLEHGHIPEVVENPENNFAWCDCKPEP
jgi:hypothetical protein